MVHVDGDGDEISFWLFKIDVERLLLLLVLV